MAKQACVICALQALKHGKLPDKTPLGRHSQLAIWAHVVVPCRPSQVVNHMIRSYGPAALGLSRPGRVHCCCLSQTEQPCARAGSPQMRRECIEHCWT